MKKKDIIIDEVSVMTDEMYRKTKKLKPLLKDCIFYQFKKGKNIFKDIKKIDDGTDEELKEDREYEDNIKKL